MINVVISLTMIFYFVISILFKSKSINFHSFPAMTTIRSFTQNDDGDDEDTTLSYTRERDVDILSMLEDTMDEQEKVNERPLGIGGRSSGCALF